MVESEAVIAALGDSPMDFIFSRPFIVYMKKRGCDQPFFVMWVDNAELLNKKNKTINYTFNDQQYEKL